MAGALLALRASGQALGWGYQLQSPPVVAALATLFFVLGLNLSGVFEWGLRLQGAAGSVRDRGGLRGAFLSGLLATVVAAPCTAPFMGAALGFALTQPPGQAMLVFTALALGMAAPYVLLSFQPGLAEAPAASRPMDGDVQATARLPHVPDRRLAGLGARRADGRGRGREAARGPGAGGRGAVGLEPVRRDVRQAESPIRHRGRGDRS